MVGFSLGYFDRDYDPIGGIPAEATYTGTNFGNGAPDLFNGNIRHMVTAIDGLEVHGYGYSYDQLQRLINVKVFRKEGTGFDWNHSPRTGDYASDYRYDRNGNLLSLERNGFGSAVDMDRFVYNYHLIGGERSNRLSYVTDNGTDYAGYDDIKSGQVAGNYVYNKIGELIEDASEDMKLEWRYGDHKLSKITRTDAASPNITFLYTPFGQRAMKLVEGRSGGSLTGEQNFTYYSYDANGQVMAVYEIDLSTDSYKLNERHLYGAERLGVNSEEVTIYQGGNFTSYTHKEEDVVHTDQRGNKRYELTNHLGNVLAVINDRKMWDATDGNYDPVILSWSDYYAFGMTMPGRNGGVDYRYQFNGMEHDGELSGNGNSYTTEFRQYDPRLGRWKSLDPLMAKFPSVGPYVYCLNNPIVLVDGYGDEPIKPNVGGYKALIKELRAADVKSLGDLVKYFGGNQSTGEGTWSFEIRYIYSKSWGWLDMRHFSSGAQLTDNTFITGNFVLTKGEEHERETESTEPDSAWDYEDLPSNLLGVYFETFLESDEATGDDFLDNLELYFKYLDFVEKPLEVAANKDEIQDEYLPTDVKRDNGVLQNETYDPVYTTKEQSGWLDKRINEYKNDFINGNTNRRDLLIKEEKKAERKAEKKIERIKNNPTDYGKPKF